MRHEEEQMVKQYVVTKTTCDLCGTDFKDVDRAVKLADQFAAKDAKPLEYTSSKFYPGGSGDSTTTQADICGLCFEVKVIPALKAIGVKFRETEVSW